MARIRSFSRGRRDVRVHSTEVDCEYQIVQSPMGPLVQLSTFGSDSRKLGPKLSQTIQVDKAGAKELLAIIRTAFPDLSP